MLDYIAAFVLLVAPVFLKLETVSPFAYWLSVLGGIFLVLYSLFTDYESSMSKIIPFKIHLLSDLSMGIIFLVAPFLFGFTGMAMLYYLIMGFGIIAVVSVTELEETHHHHHHHHHA
jgi:uncharacterized membrane protein YuzA (DUF378 family)